MTISTLITIVGWVENLRMSLVDHKYVDATIAYHDRREADNGCAILDLADPSNTTFILEPRPVRIENARAQQKRLSLETSGFEMASHDPTDIDFFDQRDLHERYFPEIESLIRRRTGADEIILFGDALRSDDPNFQHNLNEADISEADFSGETPDRLGPAPSAHIDYDENTVRAFIRGAVSESEAQRLEQKHFKLINTWRGVGTVERTPLALCDAASVAPSDFMRCEIKAALGPKDADSTFGYNVAYNPNHHWYYYPLMQADELLLFILCDSDPDALQFTAHTSFKDPTSSSLASPRLSYEVRAICFFS